MQVSLFEYQNLKDALQAEVETALFRFGSAHDMVKMLHPQEVYLSRPMDELVGDMLKAAFDCWPELEEDDPSRGAEDEQIAA